MVCLCNILWPIQTLWYKYLKFDPAFIQVSLFFLGSSSQITNALVGQDKADKVLPGSQVPQGF